MYGVFFLVAFGLTVVMLWTDTNLRTDFGTVSSGYYAHWYVVLVTGLADLLGAGLLLALRSRRALQAGVAGSGLLALIFVGDILTYSQVGFSSASQFADYLFGVTYYGGDIRYLYDALLAFYVATFLVGIVLVRTSREPSKPAPKPWSQVPAGPSEAPPTAPP